MKCLHHNDHDGRCAAFWVMKRFKNDVSPDDFIEIDYGMDVEWFTKISKDEKVVIVDFSLEPDDMRKLLNKTKDVIWIDHHKTAIDKYKDFDVEISGLRYNGIAGCVLTYCYFFEMNDGKTEFDPESMPVKAPWMTKYIGDRDVWTFEYGKETTYFNLGLDAVENLNNPFNPLWNKLLDVEEIMTLIKNGEIIEKFRSNIASTLSSDCGFEYELEGIKTFCVNNPLHGSEWFGNDILTKYPMVCKFSMLPNGKWEYSLYSENKIDTSEISKKYGGGGHPGASGFILDKLLFKF